MHLTRTRWSAPLGTARKWEIFSVISIIISGTLNGAYPEVPFFFPYFSRQRPVQTFPEEVTANSSYSGLSSLRRADLRFSGGRRYRGNRPCAAAVKDLLHQGDQISLAAHSHPHLAGGWNFRSHPSGRCFHILTVPGTACGLQQAQSMPPAFGIFSHAGAGDQDLESTDIDDSSALT